MANSSWVDTFNSEAKTAIYLYLAFKGVDYGYNISHFFQEIPFNRDQTRLKTLNHPNKVNGLLREMEKENLLVKWSDVSEYMDSFNGEKRTLPEIVKKTNDRIYYAVNPNAIYLDSNDFLTNEEVEDLKNRERISHNNDEEFTKTPIQGLIFQKFNRAKIVHPLNDQYVWTPGIFAEQYKLSDEEIARVLLALKRFDYLTILIVLKQLLIHIVATTTIDRIPIHETLNKKAIYYNDLPQNDPERRIFVEKIIDQEREDIVKHRDSQIRDVMMRIRKMDRKDVSLPSTLFQFLSFERTINPSNLPLSPDNPFRLLVYRDYEDSLIEIDMTISKTLMEERIRQN